MFTCWCLPKLLGYTPDGNYVIEHHGQRRDWIEP